MNLYPKARPVRIKLVVGGEEHSSLESLRDNFDVEEIIRLYENGGLRNWLRQIKNEEEIWEQLEDKKNLESLLKYKEIFDSFFPGKKLSLRDRLFYLKENHDKSFRKLLTQLISKEELPLTAKEALLLRDSFAERGDTEACRLIGEWYHRVFEKESDKLLRTLKQIIRRRNSDAESDECDFDYENLSSAELNKNNYKFTQYEKEILNTDRNDLEQSIETIMTGRFRVQRLKNGIGLDLNGFKNYCSFDQESWSHINSYISNITETWKSTAINSWKWAIFRMFVIGLALKDFKSILGVNGYSPLYIDFNTLRSYFERYGGIEWLKDEQKKIYQNIGGSVLRDSEGIKRLLYQSLLFVSINCLSTDDESIRDLCNSGYRPALLELGYEKPANELEREFVALDDIRKVQFLIQHLLEM